MNFRIIIVFMINLISLSLIGQSNFKVLCVLPNKLGANFNLNTDHFEYFGWDVTTTGITQTIATCNWSASGGNLPVEVDVLLSDIESFDNWDVIAIMPANWWSGNAYGDLISDSHFLNLLQQASEQNKIIWATCAGVRVLAYADILNGVNVTGKAYFESEYVQAGANYLGENILPVIDGNIITSTRGMYYQYQNINAIINAHTLLSKGKLVNRIPGITNTYSRVSDTLSGGFRQLVLSGEHYFYLCGYQYSGEGNCDILISKTDENGIEIWSQTWDNGKWDYANSICRTPNNDLLVTGFTTQPEHQQDIVVLRYNDDGDLLWQSIIGGVKPETGNAVLQASNGNIYVCGHTESYGSGEDDVYLICLDPEGNFLWHQTYGGSASDMGKDMIESLDGNLLIAGNTGSYGAGNRDVYLLKIDLNGNQIWTKTFGTVDYQDVSSVIETSDKSILLTGQTDIISVDLMDAMVIKVDSVGNEIWNYHYEAFEDFYDFGGDIRELASGNYMVAGRTKHIEGRKNRGLAFIIDSNGDELWKKEYGNNESNWIHSLTSFSENKFIFCGHRKYEPDSSYIPWIFSIDNPLTNTSPIPYKKKDPLSIYPNPFKNKTHINIENRDFQNAIIRITDLGGKCIRSYHDISSNNLPVIWDGKDQQGFTVETGVYFVSFSYGSVLYESKIVFIND